MFLTTALNLFHLAEQPHRFAWKNRSEQKGKVTASKKLKWDEVVSSQDKSKWKGFVKSEVKICQDITVIVSHFFHVTLITPSTRNRRLVVDSPWLSRAIFGWGSIRRAKKDGHETWIPLLTPEHIYFGCSGFKGPSNTECDQFLFTPRYPQGMHT